LSAKRRDFALGHADEAAHRRFEAAQVVGVVTWALQPVFVGEVIRGGAPATRVARAFGHEGARGFGLAGFDADVVQADEVGGQCTADADAAAPVGQGVALDIQVSAGGDAGGRTFSDLCNNADDSVARRVLCDGCDWETAAEQMEMNDLGSPISIRLRC
jgi:hypothetical protein